MLQTSREPYNPRHPDKRLAWIVCALLLVSFVSANSDVLNPSLPWSVENRVLDSSRRALYGDFLVPRGRLTAGSLPGDGSTSRKRVISIVHPNWANAREATISMGLPSVQSTNLGTEPFLSWLIDVIEEERIDALLVGGLPQGFAMMACVVHAFSRGLSASTCGLKYKLRNHPQRFKKDVQVMAIYHGSPAFHVNNPGELENFHNLLEATKKGHIFRVGVLQHGFMQTLRAMGVPSFPISNFLVPTKGALRGPVRSTFNKQFHVGVFGGTTTIKNVMMQIAAACRLGPEVRIHALDSHRGQVRGQYPEKNCPLQIIWHPHKMEHSIFGSLLSQMDVNMYVGFTEYRPMVYLESIQQGVPALLSHVTTLFTGSKPSKRWPYPVLQDLLVCPESHNANTVRACLNRLRRVLTEPAKSRIRSKLYSSMEKFINNFNPVAEKLLNEMLEGKPERYFSDNHKHRVFLGSSRLSRAIRQDLELLPRTDCSSLPPGAPVDKWLSPQHTAVLISKVIVFCTYEMGGVNAGGMGTFLDALIRLLLPSGIRIIVLYDDIPEHQMNDWKRRTLHGAGLTGEQQLKIASLQSIAEGICSRCGVDTSFERPTELWKRAALWERGITKLYHHPDFGPFDAVEFFEYFGPATELLLRRHQQLSGQDTSESVPLSVVIIVRVHGSISFINAVENRPMTKENYLLGVMERAGLAMADVVFYPSKPLRAFYEKSFNLQSRRVALAPPPMKSVLATIYDSAQSSVQTLWDASTKRDLLVYGKLQDTKGVFIILDVMIQLFKLHAEDGHRRLQRTHIHFYGMDVFGTVKVMRRRIPLRFQEQVHFHGPVPRQSLPKLVTHFRAAVFASQFESFCLSAHELHFLHMPLVVPDTLAFEPFTEATAFRWKIGDKESLQTAILRAIVDDEGLQNQQRADRLSYENPLSVYRSLFAEHSHTYEHMHAAPHSTQDSCRMQRLLHWNLHDWQARSMFLQPTSGHLINEIHRVVTVSLLMIVLWWCWRRSKCSSLLQHMMYVRARKKNPSACV